KLSALRIHICMQDLRHQLYKEHHSYYAERIGNTVSDGGVGGTCGIKRRCKSRRTRQGSGHHTDCDISRNSCNLDDTCCHKSTDRNNDKSEQNIRFRIDLKVTEELRSGNKADRRNEADE